MLFKWNVPRLKFSDRSNDNMPPKTKVRSIRRKKRKFYGKRFTKTKEQDEEDIGLCNSSSDVVDETSIGGVRPNDNSRSSTSDEEMADELPAESTATPKTRQPASVRKLAQDMSEEDTASESTDSLMDDSSDITGFRFVDISMLTEVFQMLLCPECKAGNISIEEESMKMGFASTITVACEKEKCNFSASFCTSSKVGHSYEVNRRALLAARNIGVGHQGLTKFAAVMNMPQPMSKNAYRNATKTVHKAAKEIVTKSMSEAASQTKEFYDEDEDGHIDIGFSGDGTWRKRGFKSSTGVVSVMSIVTGKVLDVDVMSKECRACLLNTRKEGSQEYKDWWDSHKNVCHINFSGSSGRMDASGCLEMFQRSEEKHSLRYTEFLGDGDSKAHKQLLEKKVYGDKPFTKLECVGHIKKRMGSRLRSLKKRCGKEPLGDGKSIGGKGRLTDKLIDSLQVHYGKAIRSNLQSKGNRFLVWVPERCCQQNKSLSA